MSNALAIRPGKGRKAGPQTARQKPVTLPAGTQDTGPTGPSQLLDYAAQHRDNEGDQPHADPGPEHVRARITQARALRADAIANRYKVLFPH